MSIRKFSSWSVAKPLTGLLSSLNAPSHGDPERQPQTFAQEIKIASGAIERWPGKIANVFQTIGNYIDPRVLPQRLGNLEAAGVLDPSKRPSLAQIFAGGAIMFFGVINPDYTAFSHKTGTSIPKKNLLRLLMQPAGMMDPFGFFTANRNVIAEHLLQTEHRDARYDFDLYYMWPDGDHAMQALRAEVAAVNNGTHPYTRELSATVESSDYYERLIGYIDRFAEHDHNPASMAREGVRMYIDSRGTNLTAQFAGLRGFAEYCHALPASFFELCGAVATELRRIVVVDPPSTV